MSNTRRTVTLDLSGLQANSTAIAYPSFSAPALNGLLYNEVPIHSGGSIFSAFKNLAGPSISALKTATGPSISALKTAAGPTMKSALGSAKGVFGAAVKEAAIEGAQGVFQSSMQNRTPSPNRSSSMQNRTPSPNRPLYPNRSLSTQNLGFSSTSPEREPVRSANPNVLKLTEQLNKIGIQQKQLGMEKQQILNALKGLKN